MRVVRAVGVAVLLLLSIPLGAALADAPEGWTLVGRGTEDYAVGVEHDELQRLSLVTDPRDRRGVLRDVLHVGASVERRVVDDVEPQTTKTSEPQPASDPARLGRHGDD